MATKKAVKKAAPAEPIVKYQRVGPNDGDISHVEVQGNRTRHVMKSGRGTRWGAEPSPDEIQKLVDRGVYRQID